MILRLSRCALQCALAVLAVGLVSPGVLGMSKFEQLPTEERWALVQSNLKRMNGMSYEEVIKLLGKPNLANRDHLAYNLAEETDTYLTFDFDEGRVCSIEIHRRLMKAVH